MKKLKPKRTKGRVQLLRTYTYREHMVYIRYYTPDIFAYDLVHDGQIYFSYIVITPAKGFKHLTEQEIQNSMSLIMTGAQTTIDQIMGIELSEEDKRRAQMVIDVQKVDKENREYPGDIEDYN